jgi:carbamoyltransferase
MKILGLSAFYHDSAAALIEDGRILAAAQEERFSRRKHDARFPLDAVRYCLEATNTNPAEIDSVVFYDKPLLKLERLVKTYLAYAPRGFETFQTAAPLWVRKKMFHKKLISEGMEHIDRNQHWSDKLLFTEHHVSHAASAFFPSPFKEAMVLTLDGVGEWATTSVAYGNDAQLNILKEIRFPHSLGLLYSAFTSYLGFKVNSGEYKVMGLAPYGTPKYVRKILTHLIDVKSDGSFRLNLAHFNYCVGLTMTTDSFHKIFGMPARKPNDPLTQEHMDIASSIQCVLEDVILGITRGVARESSVPNLCMAGGVALNCVANGKILRDGRFKNLWVQPASGDAGGAIGAALMGFYAFHGQKRDASSIGDSMQGSYLGPEYSQEEIVERLNLVGAKFTSVAEGALISIVAKALADGKAVGWFQGRMEFGPRALGARSILGDARSPTMQSLLNLKIKYRESFRPFAPSVLRERVSDYFDLSTESPYMLLVADVKKQRRREPNKDKAEENLFGIAQLNVSRSDIPAVTHIDYSARVHTVNRATNQRYYDLIVDFERLTGCAVLVNTSFNVRGEPIVCTPEDAFRCFMGTEIEMMAIGNCVLRKEEQHASLREDYRSAFELD